MSFFSNLAPTVSANGQLLFSMYYVNLYVSVPARAFPRILTLFDWTRHEQTSLESHLWPHLWRIPRLKQSTQQHFKERRDVGESETERSVGDVFSSKVYDFGLNFLLRYPQQCNRWSGQKRWNRVGGAAWVDEQHTVFIFQARPVSVP